MQLVIDASVYAKWAIPEEQQEKALKIRDAYIAGALQVYAPPLLLTEVGNIVWKAVTLKELFPPEKGIQILQALWELSPEIVEINRNDAAKSLDIALNLNVTFYDALYLTTAKTLDTVCLTADKELYTKAKKRDDLNVLLLEHYSIPESD